MCIRIHVFSRCTVRIKRRPRPWFAHTLAIKRKLYKIKRNFVVCLPCCTGGALLTYYGESLSNKENATKKFAVKMPLISGFKLELCPRLLCGNVFFINDLTRIVYRYKVSAAGRNDISYSKSIAFGISVFFIYLTSTFLGISSLPWKLKLIYLPLKPRQKWFNENRTSALNPYLLLTAISIKVLTIALNKLRYFGGKIKEKP